MKIIKNELTKKVTALMLIISMGLTIFSCMNTLQNNSAQLYSILKDSCESY